METPLRKAGEWNGRGQDCSAWRPAEGATTKNVDVQVENALSTVFTSIDHSAITACQSEQCGDFGNRLQEVSGKLRIAFREIVE